MVHIISADTNERPDITQRRDKLVAQINSVICTCTFVNLDPVVKTMLLKTYCLSLYGCELWDRRHTAIDKLCKSLHLDYGECGWGLPYRCHTAIL